jgi:hypothetical protein
VNHKEGITLTWELFEKELIALFEPTEYEVSTKLYLALSNMVLSANIKESLKG